MERGKDGSPPKADKPAYAGMTGRRARSYTTPCCEVGENVRMEN